MSHFENSTLFICVHHVRYCYFPGKTFHFLSTTKSETEQNNYRRNDDSTKNYSSNPNFDWKKVYCDYTRNYLVHHFLYYYNFFSKSLYYY